MMSTGARAHDAVAVTSNRLATAFRVLMLSVLHTRYLFSKSAHYRCGRFKSSGILNYFAHLKPCKLGS